MPQEIGRALSCLLSDAEVELEKLSIGLAGCCITPARISRRRILSNTIGLILDALYQRLGLRVQRVKVAR